MPLILKLDKEQNADDYRYLNIPEEENLIKLIYRDMGDYRSFFPFAYIVKRHIVGGGNSRLFSVHPPLLIVRYQC